VLAGWALWSARPRRSRPPFGPATLRWAIGLGWAGHVRHREVQRALERARQSWLPHLIRRDTDPFKVDGLGEIGEVKLSSRILLRVESPMRAATGAPAGGDVQRVQAPAWYAWMRRFGFGAPESDGATWKLGPCRRARPG